MDYVAHVTLINSNTIFFHTLSDFLAGHFEQFYLLIRRRIFHLDGLHATQFLKSKNRERKYISIELSDFAERPKISSLRCGFPLFSDFNQFTIAFFFVIPIYTIRRHFRIFPVLRLYWKLKKLLLFTFISDLTEVETRIATEKFQFTWKTVNKRTIKTHHNIIKQAFRVCLKQIVYFSHFCH